MDFIITTIKNLGWHWCSLRSKHAFITLNEHGPYWLHTTDGWRNSTTKCILQTVRSAFLWTISPGIQLIMNQQMCSWNFSNQTWPHLCNHVTLTSFVVSRHFITVNSAIEQLSLMTQVNMTSTRSIFLKRWWWLSVRGTKFHCKWSQTAGVTQRFNRKCYVSGL